MTKQTESDTPKNNSNTSKTGVTVAVITLLGVVITALLSYFSTRAQIELPIQSTQTAAAKFNVATASATPLENVVSTSTITVLTVPTIIFGPVNGQLEHTQENIIPSHHASVWLQNSIVQVKFTNPYDVTEGKWSYGIGFRHTGNNQAYRLSVVSDGSWELYLAGKGNMNADEYIFKGRLNNLDTTVNGSNDIQLVIQNGTADFFLNNVLIASLDVSDKNIPGDIFVGTGFVGEDQIPDEFTIYENFTIWELP